MATSGPPRAHAEHSVIMYERANKLQLMDLILVLVEEEEEDDFVTKTFFYYRETFRNDKEHINFYCPETATLQNNCEIRSQASVYTLHLITANC